MDMLCVANSLGPNSLLIWYDALVRNISAWYDPLHHIFLPGNARGDVECSDEEHEEKRGPLAIFSWWRCWRRIHP